MKKIFLGLSSLVLLVLSLLTFNLSYKSSNMMIEMNDINVERNNEEELNFDWTSDEEELILSEISSDELDRISTRADLEDDDEEVKNNIDLIIEENWIQRFVTWNNIMKIIKMYFIVGTIYVSVVYLYIIFSEPNSYYRWKKINKIFFHSK